MATARTTPARPARCAAVVTYIALLALATLSNPASAETMVRVPGLQGLGTPTWHQLHSEKLDRGFHLFVKTPPGLAPDASVPVVYLLDGGRWFPVLAGYYDGLRFEERLGDVVLVAISYGAERFRDGNLRSTDYTAPAAEYDYWGGAGAYLEMLETELMPFVEARHPQADPTRRVVFGHSLGGQFVLYAALHAPQVFRAHISSNPALHRNLDHFLDTPLPDPVDSALFVADATDDDPVFAAPRSRSQLHPA